MSVEEERERGVCKFDTTRLAHERPTRIIFLLSCFRLFCLIFALCSIVLRFISVWWGLDFFFLVYAVRGAGFFFFNVLLVRGERASCAGKVARRREGGEEDSCI